VPVFSNDLFHGILVAIALMIDRGRIHPAGGIGLVLALLCSTGCHRAYYRKQADCEAHALIAEKSADVARAPNVALHVAVDRRSRMYNPFDLDFQPMPLDDPASHQYMQCVDGRRGYPMWDAAGLTNTAESPDWWQFLPLDENGVLVLDAEDAVRIALLHSPQYQRQLEQLYLSALAVSAERFQFDTQFFGGAGLDLTRQGELRSLRPGGSTQFGLGNNFLTLNRTFATGGQLIAGVANSIVWELSGPNSQSATTILDFTLLQPLLRRAGRDVVLEQLTQAERALLADVRAFERFRRSFYLNITIGRPLESTIQLGGTPIGNPGGVGFGAGGFLGLLQDNLQIRNSEENIARQTENLVLLQEQLTESLTQIPESGDPGEIVNQRLQVAQARSQLLRSQSGLVNQQAAYQRSLDQFLRTLGLPPYICIELDDPILDQFELIDRLLLTRNEQLSQLRARVGEINLAILERAVDRVDPDSGIPVSQIAWSPELASDLATLQDELEPLIEFVDELIETDLPAVETDIDRFGQSLEQRRTQSQEMLAFYREEQQSICGLLNLSEIDESIFAVEGLAGLEQELDDARTQLKQRLASYRARVEALDDAFDKLLSEGPELQDSSQLAERLLDEIAVTFQDLLVELGDDVLTLQLIQARARTESVFLPAIEIDPETAFQIARRNRRDWANARAALVDQWRLIEVIADDLESDLDVVFSGDIGNASNNPLDLRSSTGQLRVGLQWDAPITRLLERNAYRATLINYERAKRDYYQFEDGIWQLLRAEVRQLHANRLTFELGRQAVRIAAQQIELNADRRALNDARGRPSGPTAARDAIDALAALLDAQNSLLNIFVSYEVVRRGLEFDLGTMELTPEGLWLDSGEFSTGQLLSLSGTAEAGMIGGRCNDCCLPRRTQPLEPQYGRISATPVNVVPQSTDGLIDSALISPPMETVHVAELPPRWQALTRPPVETTPSDLPLSETILQPGGGTAQSE